MSLQRSLCGGVSAWRLRPIASGGIWQFADAGREILASLKLDELIRAAKGAHNGLLDLEELSEAEIEAFRHKYVQLAEQARTEIRHAQTDTGSPQIDFPS